MGWLTISGERFAVEPPSGRPHRRRRPARLPRSSAVAACRRAGGPRRRPDRQSASTSVPGETAYVDIGAPLATGLHQVDNPAFDRDGNLFVTFSGSRGQQSPVSIFVVRPDGSREPFVSDLPNPTSLAFGPRRPAPRVEPVRRQRLPHRRVTVARSSRPILVSRAGSPLTRTARSSSATAPGSILRVRRRRRVVFAALPPSIAAFHLAFGPDGSLFVTGPTLTRATASIAFPDRRRRGLLRRASAVRRAWRSTPRVGSTWWTRLPARRRLSLRAGHRGAPEQLVVGGGLVGVAFAPDGALAVASADAVYQHFPVDASVGSADAHSG